ncbi:type I glyceraldehyde-3-phosphate dehydrogenase [Echinicola jeungdonensis]|uniref:Glyceraldehyde-3-phosphate dehydrogenase n=1 Tax=Echinicola jeungdonensis TaxID=709343 RepID=A0ABV5J7T1_9BACT|nr:type I glyceraldehyde-3-phosphate dehydrogenase [Echinicola jeungdonensis]MDN3670948.1 type I glyceraldehyde-3-phosphate dehydrogenase [Echinicola jeungdonensis]
MTKLRVAINGFGRIGKLTFKLLLEKKNIEVVAINDLMDTNTLVHLLKYDSIHGKFEAPIQVLEDQITVKGQKVRMYSQKDPADLPWKSLDVDLVIEATGRFTHREGAERHLVAGAKRVIISAPAQSKDIPTVVLGVNEGILSGEETIISNASCTTNCLAPMVKILDDAYGVDKAFISTVHAYTADQNIQDAPHRDLRRARAASCSIIPTTTNAAKAVELVLPHLSGKLHAMAYRVPVPDGSLTELNVVLQQETNLQEIKKLFKSASKESMQGILAYTEDPIVSSDIIGNPYSCIFDSDLTVVQGNFVKIIGWYDNESGYSNRMLDLIQKLIQIKSPKSTHFRAH